MESRNLDSPKEKTKFDTKAHSLSFVMLDDSTGRVTRYTTVKFRK